ncbi:E3 ubiquitin-protein ligase TRIM21-like [Scomber japonicus]|uniref:E3 ubiquitin-protein ligase TRIM21-like n=1 Tax=Scomber japonicus TaxID=13676 RepID=UPI0023059069|nr:E3 ubiquitin-protein ligase TRIM21-like [Scomber japonicus]
MVRKRDLLKTLEDLRDEEFEDFKCLLKYESLAGYQTIKAPQLQNAERRDTVDLMVQTYQLPGAVEATKKLLKTINRNDLLQSLSDISSGPQEQQAAKPRVCAGTKLKACLVFLGILVFLVILVCRVFICNGTVISVQHPSSYETTTEGTTEGATVAQLEQTLSTKMKNQFEVELKRVQQYAVDVTLDPDTANPWLILSADGKQVYCGDVKKNLPDNPERFSKNPCVLGKQSFSSGRFYFEVQVKEKTDWDLGVARESINRKAKIILSPEDGFWTIWLRNGNEYKALDDTSVRLSLKSRPQKVGVFVDYEEGLVSFYNVDAAALIYSFTGCSFTEKLYPFFSPSSNDGGKNSAPLIICPVNQTA